MAADVQKLEWSELMQAALAGPIQCGTCMKDMHICGQDQEESVSSLPNVQVTCESHEFKAHAVDAVLPARLHMDCSGTGCHVLSATALPEWSIDVVVGLVLPRHFFFLLVAPRSPACLRCR